MARPPREAWTPATAAHLDPGSLSLVWPVAAASWLFMMVTVLCYKLDYIGQRTGAQVISAAHLALCLAAFGLGPNAATAFAWVALGDAVVFAIALRACLASWRHSAYTLFWRHAIAW